jgi:two-component system CheB/CheR fusion protein
MATPDVEHGQLVVTGSSAGGIEALSVVLSALPSDFPAAIVIAQHLDPRVPSSLAAILAKHTPLRVVAVNDHARLVAGTVYVVPSDRNVEISAGTMTVFDGSSGRPKPSIDRLFASAAVAFGERLTAVVLTGLGSDGTDGARAVKQHGGTVIIEDPLTASFPAMPASLEPGMVDVIAPLERIAGELVRIVDESIDLPADSPEVGAILDRIRTVSGIDFSHYKPATIRRRLARQIALTGHRDIAEYLAFLEREPTEFGHLITNFLIKVTQFFRDSELFRALGETIIPALIDEARARGGRELRVWSAGCATGEEAYSLAILIAEALRDDPQPPNVRIFATDIDEAAISFARRGIYPRESIETIEPALVERYFTVTDHGWEVGKDIRAMTVFGQHDLGQRAPFPRIDLALCRNVLIYFSKDLQARTLQIFAFSLRNGGYLALGKAETTNPLAEFFAVVDPSLRIFRRYGERVTIPAPPAHKYTVGTREVGRVRSPFPAFEPAVRDNRSTINEKLGAFLTTSSIGVILVDRHYDIVSINASAREMLNIHGVAIGEDLVHLAPPSTSAQVRAMLDGALRNLEPTAGGDELTVGPDGTDEPRFLALSCYPEIGERREVTGAVILAVDVTDVSRARREAEVVIAEQRREIEALRRSEAHARERQRNLLDANKELASVNSGLRAQNDALVIDAEEAEAATEEIETLNEEMQATNEELETLNEEFQATIEELNTTNDEHAARGRDLQEQVTVREIERKMADERVAALTAMLDELPTALAAVDRSGAVLASNRLFREIQEGAKDRSVQIDDDGGATISFSVVLRRAGEGQTFTFRYRSIDADQTSATLHGRAAPISAPGPVSGLVALIPLAGSNG